MANAVSANSKHNRLWFANITSLALLLTLPVALSSTYNSHHQNAVITPLLQSVFIVINIQHLKNALMHSVTHQKLYFFIGCLFIVIGFGSPRTEIYFVNAIFFICLLTLFSELEPMQFKALIRIIFTIKVLVLVLVCIYLTAFYTFIHQESFQQALHNLKFPIYRHIRHFNYDLAFTIPLAAYLFISSTSKFKASISLFSLFLFAYFALATGGRGQALSLLVTAIAVRAVLLKPENLKKTVIVFATIVLGFVSVFITNQHHYLLGARAERSNIFENSISSTTSGRVNLWRDTTEVFLQQDLAHQLFGGKLDPVVYIQEAGHDYAVHPHNIFIQALLEYGYFGLIIFTLIYIKIFSISLKSCRQLNETSTSAAILLGMLIFSLVDGVFFHAIPLTMSTILLATIVAKKHGNVHPYHLLNHPHNRHL